MNGKTKSILLKVAFKGATCGLNKGDPDTIKGLYETLLALHEQLGIDPDDDGYKSGGGRAPAFGSGGGGSASLKEGAPFNSSGVQWLDFRAAKVEGRSKPKHPDFKTADGKESVYKVDFDGNPNEEFGILVAAAELGVPF